MKTRAEIFRSLSSHAWLGRVYGRLSHAEISLAESFLAKYSHLGAGDFEHELHRMWLDKKEKPKHAREISELLCCANSAWRNK
jgi:hypothetical protein